jgi:putative phosphoesterase
VRIVVVSDTHVPDFARALPAGLVEPLRRADSLLHAGDVTRSPLLDELAAFAPVRVAMGNGDGPDVRAWGAEDVVRMEVEGVHVAMLHIAGPAKGREGRMRRAFPDADVVVFGHSHIPMNMRAGGQLLFNPGSPTWKRRQPRPTFGVLEIRDGAVDARIEPLDA